MNKFLSYLRSLITAIFNRTPEIVSPGQLVSSIELSGVNTSVISPTDGYAHLTAAGLNDQNSYLILGSNTGLQHQHSSASLGHGGAVHIPVKKGESVYTSWAGFGEGAYLNFFSRVGGD